ncbi:MAG: hypothetical protein RLY46_1630 [Bacteroidota bacterium]|jgi:hypothetical protein
MKKQALFMTLVLIFVAITVQAEDSIVNKSILKDGVSLGSVIAVVISWDRNKSILLAIFHALLSWIYVIYTAFFTKD